MKPKDVDFCYGSCDGYLWRVLDKIFELHLLYDNSHLAILQRKEFLKSWHIGICDIVQSCKRQTINALDSGMSDVVLRDILGKLEKYPSIETLIFTGGNSKNSPEYFFRKLLKQQGISFTCKEKNPPKKHEFYFNSRVIKTISLTSPSGSANRSIGANQAYKAIKAKNPNFTTFDFRVLQYKKVFYM